MIADRQVSPEHRSIVLVDWSRHNEPTAHTGNSLLYELMLLSLLYDEVLVQDEILVASKKMASWFSEPQSFRLLEELFAVAGIVLLKRPLGKYPPELQRLAQEKPITARSEYLKQFSVGNDGKQLRFTNRQRIFQTRLEACLLASPSAHRDAGSKRALHEDLMQSFGSLLSTVLTDEHYRKWRRRRFLGLSPRMAQDFLEFVRDPEAASRRILKKGQQPKLTLERDRPVFSTALAVQVAGTYPPLQANAMQELIETVFAVPYCEDEGAEGRYGKALRELPFPMDDAEGEGGPVKVEVETKVPIILRLPTPQAGFAEIIGEVRENSGKELRNAMARLGDDFSFDRVQQAWYTVADEIASGIASKTKAQSIALWGILGSLGTGIIADLVTDPPSSAEVPAWLKVSVAGTVFSLGIDYLYNLLRADLQRQKISGQLEETVEFRCVKIPRLSTTST